MIYTSVKSGDGWTAYPPAIRRALEYLRDTDVVALEPGDYPILGDRMFAKVFDLTTRPVENTRPEVHRKYIDMQVWPSGSERFGIAPYLGGGRVVEAREAADTWFLESVPDESFVLARPGCVAVFFPWDAHRPGVALGEPTTFRKCVVKVSMELLEQELPA